jgi:hypothetical protein
MAGMQRWLLAGCAALGLVGIFVLLLAWGEANEP